MASRVQEIATDTAPCLTTAAIPAFSVLAADGSNAGNVKLCPAYTQSGTLLKLVGVSTELSSIGGNVKYCYLGQVRCVSDGTAVINPYDIVIPSATVAGSVMTYALAGGADTNLCSVVGQCVDMAQIPATAGAIVTVRLMLEHTITG